MSTLAPIYLFLISLTYFILYRRDKAKTTQSGWTAWHSLLKMLPLLAAIFALIGLFQVFVPPQLIERTLGKASGLMALLMGGGLGAVAIGPPLAAFPLAGSLLEAGAWPPAVAAFIVSWISVGMVTLPFESEVFGFRYALMRNLVAFGSALLIGLIIGSLT